MAIYQWMGVILLMLAGSPAVAGLGIQVSAHHHYWDSGILNTDSAASLGLGLTYFGPRHYASAAYAYSGHSQRSDEDFSNETYRLPLTEVDMAVGYYLLSNLSAFIGMRYQNLFFSGSEGRVNNFYESGTGFGIGVRLNQVRNRGKLLLYESLALSNTWFSNRHNTLQDSQYSGLGLHTGIGILYRLGTAYSLSFDISYKYDLPAIDIPQTRQARSYLKSGANIMFVF